ncbi:MAG: NUDIX hydrolase [Nannocystaceae bacterium]
MQANKQPTPQKPSSATPAAPRLASTVVVLRPGSGTGDEVFMLRRSARSAFMPDALVFPGGKVDPGDGPSGSDEAFEQAAKRECEEESRIVLGSRTLRWFDTWTTPSAEPRRFIARFYVIRLAAGEGSKAQADGYETHGGQWATAGDFLALWEREEVDLPPPTLCTLLRLQDPAWWEALEQSKAYSEAALRETILPKWELRPPVGPPDLEYPEGDCHHVFLPHDREYVAIKGTSGSAPERVQGLPTRMIRLKKVWRPLP